MLFALKNHPILIFDAQIHVENHAGQVSRDLVDALKKTGMEVIIAASSSDSLETVASVPYLCGVILDWDSFQNDSAALNAHLAKIKYCNALLPIFIITQTHELDDTAAPILKNEVNFFWKYADTLDFMVGRIRQESKDYLKALLPPFFKGLLQYTNQHKYAWHTPGHMGGVAFLKSPIGKIFYDFYGENVFRADLSISAPELGSLMEHSGINGEAERFAAKTFGADHSFFVTNGTSTSNKMVFMSCAGKGDVVIVDRNCHKSLQHALTMTGAIPIYFKPTRNAYGIIGTIPLKEFTKEIIQAKI
ncbi:MAG: Orn/Lys/Arg decarboxylase N-terminal domain-containing protein, partial [Legionellaceae bacterium]|nr:Orn/Lys/Arg decarboxylase N-terminal domain-containing protein [Legionellaceae bacterium]